MANMFGMLDEPSVFLDFIHWLISRQSRPRPARGRADLGDAKIDSFLNVKCESSMFKNRNLQTLEPELCIPGIAFSPVAERAALQCPARRSFIHSWRAVAPLC